MKKIAVLDTTINATNLGNAIIMDAIDSFLHSYFPRDFIYRLPAMEYICSGKPLIEQADYTFFGGTNILSSDMNKTSEWRIRLTDTRWLEGVILCGAGWWQYQSKSPNWHTRFLLRNVLARNVRHSVRDQYTAQRLDSLGIGAINTGCPTLWSLTPEHCNQIPSHKSEKVLLTFTEYNQNPEYDRLLFEILRRNYSTLFFWPQQFGDYSYAHEICGKHITIIDPSLQALDSLLREEQIDYVGTRLHAGIRAMQHQRRTVIIVVDNRAAEMGIDFNLPIMNRDQIGAGLESRLTTLWPTQVRLDQQAICQWRSQFHPTPALHRYDSEGMPVRA